jgi:hypothetical protein
MNFKGFNNSNLNLPVAEPQTIPCSPILPMLKTHNTKMIIDNYQNVYDQESEKEEKEEFRTQSTSVVKSEAVLEGKERMLPYPNLKTNKILINSSSNLFTQLNDLKQNFHSSLKKGLVARQEAAVGAGEVERRVVSYSPELEPQIEIERPAVQVKVEPQQSSSTNNITNIYINYTFEDGMNKLLNKKRTRKACVGDGYIIYNTSIINIQEIKIMDRKIKTYFQELEDFNIEIIEPIYKKNFMFLNSLKNFKPLETGQGPTNKDSEKAGPISAQNKATREAVPESQALHKLEEDAIIIQRKLCVDELKNVILSIQYDYIFNSQTKPNRDSISKAVYYIDEINRLSEKLNKTPVVNTVFSVRPSKHKNKKAFQCDFCESVFSNGQALGGHMSRSHPNQSKKYYMKKKIRRERETCRDVIYQARKELFANHGLDYDQLLTEKNTKPIIRKLREENMKEYKDILDRLKKRTRK